MQKGYVKRMYWVTTKKLLHNTCQYVQVYTPLYMYIYIYSDRHMFLVPAWSNRSESIQSREPATIIRDQVEVMLLQRIIEPITFP